MMTGTDYRPCGSTYRNPVTKALCQCIYGIARYLNMTQVSNKHHANHRRMYTLATVRISFQVASRKFSLVYGI